MGKVTESKGKIWLKQKIGKYKPSIVLLAVLTVVSTVCSVGFAYLSRFLIDSATDKDSKRLLIFACVISGLLVTRIVLRAIVNYCSEKCRVAIATDIRSGLFRKILKSDYASVKEYHSGDLITRITADTNEIAGTTVGILPQAVGIIVQVIGAIVALGAIDPWFTLFLVVGGGVIIGISAILRKKTKWYYKEIMSADGQSRAFMQESVVSELTVKAFGVEEKTALKADGILNVYKKRRLGRAKLNSLMGILYAVVTNLGLVFAIVWCAVGILQGNVEYGAVLSIVLLMEQLQRPLNTVSAIMPAYYSRQASAERLLEIDSFKEELTAISEKIVDYEKVKGIKIQNASFGYGRDLVLDNFNLDIQKGKITCIYGVSGGGKSTLFKLLLGVYNLSSGRIAFDTEEGLIDVNSSHRNLFSFVPQGNFLFTGSIYENLTFFANESDENLLKEKVKKAIEDACAEFVYELPNGLETVLTEQGGGLSEGQKQRIAVARAFLSNRPILILDEATSALDEETEKRLIQNVKNMQGKTCIIISHRQAVIDFADCSVKM